ncbi:MAG: hypothetical protein AAGE84_15515 [Cyanobacteria bacterium P01_G01_bin.39]
MLWGMELSWTEEEIVRKYQPTLKKYGIYFDEEICSLIENCPQDLEYRLQAFIGWFLSLEYRASLEGNRLNLPDANETLIKAFKEEWHPTEFQIERLLQANLFSVDLAMRNKLAEINFFRGVAYKIPHNSHQIKFFHRGVMIWQEDIAKLLKVSNRGLIEMYKFKVRQDQEKTAK